jgi:hypothetical protein
MKPEILDIDIPKTGWWGNVRLMDSKNELSEQDFKDLIRMLRNWQEDQKAWSDLFAKNEG